MASMMAAPASAMRDHRPRRATRRHTAGSRITPRPLDDLGPAGLELRLHQHHQVAAGGDQREQGGRPPCAAR